MTKKKDVFSKKLKLTKQEKREHKSRMEKFKTLSLYWILLQRLLDNLNHLVDLGSLVFPNQQMSQKLFKITFRLIKKYWWLFSAPLIYHLLVIQAPTHTFSNKFF